MNDSRSEKGPKTQPAASGGPPRPPKRTVRDMDGEPPEGPYIDIPDPVILMDLATALGQKPFSIVGDAMKIGYFVTVHDGLEFGIAARIAEKYGFHARRIAE